MPPVPPTLEAMLDVAHYLIAQREFDIAAVSELLAKIPTPGLDKQTLGAIAHAKLVAATGHGRSISHVATTRFALARVVALLDNHVEVGLP